MLVVPMNTEIEPEGAGSSYAVKPNSRSGKMVVSIVMVVTPARMKVYHPWA